MNRTRSTRPDSRIAFAILAAVLVALSLAGAPPVRAADRTAADLEASTSLADWFARMEAHFDAHPELKTTPGSGWKPYNRARWFTEQRLEDGMLPAADARWKVWEAKRQRAGRLDPLARSNTWFSLGPTNFAGRILAIATDPVDASTVYAGAAGGGLWRTTDAGATWTPLTDELPSLAVGGVAVSRIDPSIVVIGTGEATNNVDRITGVGILRSTDSGTTWQTTSISLPASSSSGFHFVEAGPNGTFLAGARDGLYRSSDNGATWDTVRVGGNYYDAAWKPGEADIVYTVKGGDASGNNVKISTDDGITWVKAGTGQPLSFDIAKTKIAVTPADPEMIYAHFAEQGTDQTLGIYRSTDGGATWTARNTSTNMAGSQGWYNLSIVVDPANADRVIAGGVQLYRSTNGGTTFSTIGGNVHVDHHATAVESDLGAVWVGSDGGCWRTTNFGGAWADRNSGLVTYQFYDVCVNDNPSTSYYILGGTQDNGTDKWSGTTTWSNGLFADGMVCNVSKTDGTTVYGEIQFGSHYRNLSSGSGSWTQINGGLPSGRWVAPVDDDWNDGSHLYTGTSTGLYRTTNSGSSWTEVLSVNPVWVAISPVDGDIAYALLNANASVTTNDGVSWTTTSDWGFAAGNARRIVAHPTEAQTVFVTFSNYAEAAHVIRSTDLGVTWTDVTGDLPKQPVNDILIDPDNTSDWYIATDVGIWKSVNGGANWIPFDDGFPNTVVEDLEIRRSDRKLVAGTHGRGAWELDIPLGVVAATLATPNPRHLMLDAPYPNPVADRTLLRFAAKHDGKVTLDVYDVAGRHVINLVEMESGDGVIRTTPWFPDREPAGVYFAVLRSGAESITRKLVVAK